jgi:hypothetical protein
MAGAVGFARSLIAEGCQDLELRTARFVEERLQGSSESLAGVVQQAIAQARAETAQQAALLSAQQQQQLQQQHQQQTSALQSGLLQVQTAGVQNVAAATSTLFSTVQQELGVLRHLVADLRTSQEELRGAAQAGEAAREVITGDMERCVKEIGSAMGRIRQTEADLRKLDRRISETDTTAIESTLEEMRLAIREGADAQGSDHQDLKRLAQTVVDQHTASAAALRRLDERINARARVTSLARAEKRLGDDQALLQGQVVALANKVDDLAARVVSHQPVPGTATPLPGSGPVSSDVGAALMSLVDVLRPKPKDEPDLTVFSLAHIGSWPVLLDEGWSIFELTMLRLLPCSSETAREEVSLLLQWAKSYFASGVPYTWPMERQTAALAETLLRRARIASAGVRPSAIASAMTKVDLAGDPLGQALAAAAKGSASSKPSPKKTHTCWYCGVKGHTAHSCKARIDAGAPVPTQAPSVQPATVTTRPPAKTRPGNGVGTI